MATLLKSSSRSTSSPPASEVERKFAALAREIVNKRMTSNGLIGATIYRDSQFELTARGMSDYDRPAAWRAFRDEFEATLVKRFPGNPMARTARR